MLAKHRSEILLMRSATHDYIEHATQLYASHTETVVHYANYHRYDVGVYINLENALLESSIPHTYHHGP